MATIKQVAQLAGVSFTTVSHVLNETRPVSADARARVLAAVEALHYVPSALARSMKSRTTGTIGLIIPNNTNPYFSEVARGIQDSCYAAGYSVILCNSDDDPAKQRDYFNVLLEKRCDGLILAALAQTDSELLRKMRIPAVLLDRAPHDLLTDVVGVDNVAGGRLAAQHLLALGRRRIGCIGGPDDIDLASFVHPPLTSVAQNTRELGRLTAQCLLRRIADPAIALQQHVVAPELHVRGSSVAEAHPPHFNI